MSESVVIPGRHGDGDDGDRHGGTLCSAASGPERCLFPTRASWPAADHHAVVEPNRTAAWRARKVKLTENVVACKEFSGFVSR